jgi:cyclase
MTLMPRLIPILQICGTSAVKTTTFADARYVGSAINSLRIFSELEADELFVIDLSDEETRFSGHHLSFLESLCSEGFMPLAYGGRVSGVEQAVKLARIGFEKIVLGTAAFHNPSVVSDIARVLGAQAVVLAVDVAEDNSGHRVLVEGGSRETGMSLKARLKEVSSRDVGEVLVTSINREGTRDGLDLEAARSAVAHTHVPVIVSGGARSLENCITALELGASAVALGETVVALGHRNGTLVHLPPGASKVREWDRCNSGPSSGKQEELGNP